MECRLIRSTFIFSFFFAFKISRFLQQPFPMATLVPPPSKRQRVAQTEKARQQQEIQSIPADLGSVRVQFFDQSAGNATGPAVSVPVADANIKNLETLLNTLQGNVGPLLSLHEKPLTR